jgi:hypothetical protein
MKQIFILVLSSLLVFQLNAQQSAKKYAIKSGEIEYKLTGNTTGSRTVYFSDFGNKYYEHEKSETVTKMFGITDRTETDKITIINNGHFWTIDNLDKKNYEGNVPYSKLSEEMMANMTEAEQEKMADDILKSFGGERLGTEKILGYTCEKMSVFGSLIWFYKGVSLKSEAKVMGITANEEAVSFDENVTVPSSRYNPPSGVDFTNIEQQQNAMYPGMDMDMYEEDDDDYYQTVPVTYPFEDFQEEMNSFNPEGYVRTMVVNQDGQHVALFINGLTNVVSVMATAEENVEDSEEFGSFDSFETFTHKGKTMHYGDLSNEDMDGKALVIPYKEHDMFIIIMTVPGKDKDTLLRWADELDF